MLAENEDRKSSFDYVRLIIYIVIAGGFSIFAFVRLSFAYHSMLVGIGAGLLTEALLVWCMYVMDNGRRY